MNRKNNQVNFNFINNLKGNSKMNRNNNLVNKFNFNLKG